MVVAAILNFCGKKKKTGFACIDFSRLLVYEYTDLMENKIEEKPSVAICGGSVVIFAMVLVTLII